ncbi:phosphoenolpyruvate synthase [Paenibacillus melissococcoides]|uniref:Phosphoenolpyruvate synthase n=1 Tax=Paenibacillus melissococcoides TaxID=2912268 RepID=A0ABN8UDI3_9BACL|nr:MULTISPECIES: phosphoenolpyruvate synthase [Paenibacillus]MEB9895848.1 phosphoenolpyruvate synthase [Bacillus cereus]GIO81620.1 phosphoenolpyruvate synthase [Paenibacillus dendritiformis]CAH8249166.1 phosphoenolpyruvate synthase [Paenibacillus melissococcoides]
MYWVNLDSVNRTHLPLVGGKGANLGELRQAGFPVPPGFCVTTSVYDAVVGQSDRMDSFYEELGLLNVQDNEAIRRLSQRIQQHIGSLPIPDEMIEDILKAWREMGDNPVVAVRSSATAEDLPTASFAGQQDTLLNVKGERQLFAAIRQCWSSLFSERAIAYRIKNGFDHRSVRLAVIVQRLIAPDVSGVMFTADPITGNRSIISIDASFGLGEALVSGIVNPDLYQVRQGEIVKKQISCKKSAVYTLAEGGTAVEELPEPKQKEQALSDEEIMTLARMGERIQAHYGTEQDIEWCLSGGQFYIVQARPITSLFPIPKAPGDELHVYFSFGHIQMMTDAMSPAGISVWQMTREFASSGQERAVALVEAGGRLFMDATRSLEAGLARKVTLHMIGKMDALIGSAARQILDRFPVKEESSSGWEGLEEMLPRLATQVLKDMLEGGGQAAYTEVEDGADHLVDICRQRLDECGGADKITYIHQNYESLARYLMGESFHYMVAAMVAQHLLELLAKWWRFDGGELITLNKSLPFNVTSEMGLDLGDVADIARPYPEVTAYLRNAAEDGFMEGLDGIAGGPEFKAAFAPWLERYGVRCPGEIDIMRTRWSERPYMLIPSIVGHLDSVKHGEHRERFRQGEQEAERAAERILTQVRGLEDGAFKERIVSRLITVYRSFMGLREHHKFVLVRHLALYRKAVLELGDDLAARGVLRERNDIFFLTLPEMKEIITGAFEEDVPSLIAARQESFKHYQRLQPPRVFTSEGEIIEGRLDGGDAPEGALIGLPVSPGIVEGRARIVLDPSAAALKEGEILVAPFTDPGWTPLFQQARGLITEIGGLMTHGSVIAREYGIPAIVGVERATKLIREGDLLRLDGTTGYVIVLEEAYSMV